MSKSKLKKAIEGIPSNGWWQTSGMDSFVAIGEKLIEKGFSFNETIELLDAAYCAVSAEYGD